MTDYSPIIEMLEKADGPSRELDKSVAQNLGGAIRFSTGAAEMRYQVLWPWDDLPNQGDDIDNLPDLPHLSDSIDASIALAERLLPGGHVELTIVAGTASAFVSAEKWCAFRMYSHGSTPAIAILLAMFSALQAQETASND